MDRPCLPWRLWSPRLSLLGLALVLVAAPACRVTDLTLWKPAQPPQGTACEVECIRDVPYGEGKRNRVDLFLPKGRKGFPVALLVHGGAWIMGDNRCCGLYSSVGEYLASQGIGVVMPNYHLSPRVKHPHHIRDVARAFAWMHAHIGKYGGRTDQLFLIGHSAGGHLVALLATDGKYLREQGLSPDILRGVVAISGVYRIPPGKMQVTLGGTSPRAFRLDEVAPVRGGKGRLASGLPGIPIAINVFGPAFGDDPEVRKDASPLTHVHPGLPPFLICYAENDLPSLPEMAEDLHATLTRIGCKSQRYRIRDRNHSSVIFCAMEAEDPVAQLMVGFIQQTLWPRQEQPAQRVMPASPYAQIPLQGDGAGR